MTVALIDSDIVAFRAAASCKGDDPLELCHYRIDKLYDQILGRTGAKSFRSFLSGSRNWRKDYYEPYKANRRKQVDPIYRQQAKEYIIEHWSGEVSDGIEADDDIAIAHTETPGIICSIDKDFQQLSGSFYNFVTDTLFSIDEITATRFFYKQMMLGDKSDNVPGFDGKPRAQPTNHIKWAWSEIDERLSEHDMQDFTFEQFIEHGGDFELTGTLLYLWRKNPDQWLPNTDLN